MRDPKGKKASIEACRGAPRGNSNALTHGKRTRARRVLYAEIRAHIGEGRALVEEAMEAVAGEK